MNIDKEIMKHLHPNNYPQTCYIQKCTICKRYETEEEFITKQTWGEAWGKIDPCYKDVYNKKEFSEKDIEKLKMIYKDHPQHNWGLKISVCPQCKTKPSRELGVRIENIEKRIENIEKKE